MSELLKQRTCDGCRYLQTFTARSDERDRYGFGDVGYGCKEPGFQGYVNPSKPICVRGPYRTQATLLSKEGDDRG